MLSEATAEEQKFENKASSKITKFFFRSRAYPKPKKMNFFSHVGKFTVPEKSKLQN